MNLASIPTNAPHCSASHPEQRYFCGSTGGRTVTVHDAAWSRFAEARVYRHADDDKAQLRIRVSLVGLGADAEVSAMYAPDQLRELALRLLDAAADIERHPARIAMQKEAA